MSCTTKKGQTMSQGVFDKALEIAASREEYITLGGGEPTLHPKCLEWCMQAALATVDASESMGGPAVLIITNGKKTEIAQKLAKLSKLGVIAAELSQDEFHDEIEESTVAIFKRYAGIRDVTNEGSNPVLDVGRARESHEAGLLNVRSGCACETLFIAPNGDFYQCGCQTKKLGNILTDEIPDEYWENANCCQNELDEELEENLVTA
jgi:MoaA/NifB/PqqE/SkfB family radical SAM enzyme